jgi:hypothetical protein
MIPGECAATGANGQRCELPAQPGAPVALCANHLLAAYDWVSRDVGVTDLLPAACRACGSSLGIRYPSGWVCAACEWRVGSIPDTDFDSGRVRVDVVYYLRFGDRIKIGTSGNPRSRLAQLRFDELLAFERGGRSTEQRRHAQFAVDRFPGSEWFHTSPALADHIRLVAGGTEDPWDRYARWMSQQLALRD